MESFTWPVTTNLNASPLFHCIRIILYSLTASNMQFIPSWFQFKKCIAVETGKLHIIRCTPFPRELQCTFIIAQQWMNLTFWFIRCRDRFLHKSSMFWCGHQFVCPFQHSHTLCATCWHDRFVVHHFTPTATGTKFRCMKHNSPLKRESLYEILSRTKFRMSLLLHVNLSLELFHSDRCLCHTLQVSPTRSATSNRKIEFLTNTNMRG